MKTALKVIFIPLFVLLPEPRAGKATGIFDPPRSAQNAPPPLKDLDRGHEAIPLDRLHALGDPL